ncbi:MAG: RNA-dependent ATPase rok1 [Sclerophora amabilis]|nr:MAG: RNA-dependent ATPase rok1 [Sclerophora amabilis]
MDPLKLLTRSTNLSKSFSSARNEGAQRLPSSGQSNTPQLFGVSHVQGPLQDEDVDKSPSRKRKRGMDGLDGDAGIAEELDFFREGTAKSLDEGETKRERQQTGGLSASKNPRDATQAVEILEKPLDLSEEECRRIFKTHKLKVTVLAESKTSNKTHGLKVSKQHSDPRKKKRDIHPIETSTKKQKHAQQLFTQPLTSFGQLHSHYGISKRLLQNIQDQGYMLPTEVQIGSLPILLSKMETQSKGASQKGSNRKENHSLEHQKGPPTDLLAVAPTGSGKTLAFLIPILHGLIQERRFSRRPLDGKDEGQTRIERCIKALIVAPTKELASQIVNEGRQLVIGTGIKITEMRKGMRVTNHDEDKGAAVQSQSDEEESEDLEDGMATQQSRGATVAKPDILVTTPLLFLNTIQKSHGGHSPSLPLVKYLVLDEADVLLDPLFRSQTLAIWALCTNHSLQTSLWSATVGSNIETLVISTISSRNANVSPQPLPFRLLRLVVGLKDIALPTISHHLTYTASEPGKLLAVRQLLRPTATSTSGPPSIRPPLLIFTQTIPRAIALHAELQYDIPPEAGGPSRTAVLHADLSDTARSRIMARFRAAEIWVLITTDLLARGVDFRGINAVINYDVPNSAAAYVHRVGRTGRAGREGGVAVTLYTKEDIGHVKAVANVIAASEKAGGRVSSRNSSAADNNPAGAAGIQKWLLDALPTPSKKDKQTLKRRGVEARRPQPAAMGGKEGKDAAKARESRKMRISTKSGFDRRLMQKRKGAPKSGRPSVTHKPGVGETPASDSEWGGLEG